MFTNVDESRICHTGFRNIDEPEFDPDGEVAITPDLSVLGVSCSIQDRVVNIIVQQFYCEAYVFLIQVLKRQLSL